MVTKTSLTLIKPICKFKGCPEIGKSHDRCRGHKRNHTPCTQWPMNGQNVCRMHGGSSPRSLATAKQRVAMQVFSTEITQSIVAFDPEYDESPEEGLLREVRWSGQIAKALGVVCMDYVDDLGILTYSAGQGSQINALVDQWNKERDRHAKFCKMALDAGIQQRTLDIIESQAGAIVNAMLALLAAPELRLTSDQIIEGKVVAARVLRTLSLSE